MEEKNYLLYQCSLSFYLHSSNQFFLKIYNYKKYPENKFF